MATRNISVRVVCADSVRGEFALMWCVQELAARRWDIHQRSVQVKRLPCEQAAQAPAHGPDASIHWVSRWHLEGRAEKRSCRIQARTKVEATCSSVDVVCVMVAWRSGTYTLQTMG